HRTRNRQIPRQLRVRDVMTGHPKTITLSARADKVAELLLSSRFTGVPVIDDENHPIGIITESDLIYRAGMPMRLGLLSKYDAGRKSAVLADLSTRTAEEIMTKPAVCIEESKLLNDAVALMLRKKVNRLPVVNALYEVVGILSRVDVFRAIMHEAPDWKSFVDQNVIVENLRSVSDIMCRDTLTVSPGLPIEEVVRTAESKDFLGLPVVDDNGRFLGLLSDQDMLEEILFQNGGMFKTLIGRLPFTQAGKRRKELGKTERGRAASEIMNRETPTIHESATIEEAIELMVRTGTKRLPVVDAEHKYKGMLSREVLLRTVLTDS
ncbi:MAG: CBS domain-containing protein, partial [Syntrophobacteraceae bacterium]